ncbi:uncharacterized protein KGF55_001716 [Candida pseudojiufengensis]|uniref:uncharacterized protein n=1 Tax=Candida pseudojiufengensis TaxID=497109 RepID=UPI0022245880|nr:uncharacterized protein KGF55_001716 [Candida pseudojiufengensis]KAI5964647.1 hypothetical protein KGF55_001716 [Candida pseudojiufengensis]
MDTGGPNIKYLTDQNNTAQLAEQFNDFYSSITSPKISQVGNYRIIEEIGGGTFGKVYLAKHVLLDVDVVLKCGLIDDPNIVREIYYHKQLKHKNIVSVYEVIKTENHLWIAMEFCEGGELYYLIYEKKRLAVKECQNLFFQIVIGVKQVHSMNLSHRDLKLENILLADSRKTIVKLTDFGMIREYNPQSRKFLSTICGTSVYMAPELINGQKYSGFAIDVWSLGVILYTMLYGQLPFDDEDEFKVKMKILNDNPDFSDLVPAEINVLIAKMLNKDASQRPSIGEILNSPFLLDMYNKHLERTQRRTHGDAESIISINQHYNCVSKPFSTRIERELVRKLQKLDINIEELQASIYNNEMNSLTAFYELLLTQEFNKKKKRYIREKKRKYNEARSSLRKSRKRVKSALSLSDQSIGSQPLERIISSLSLASNRNSSKTNLARMSTYSKKSGEQQSSPKSPPMKRFNTDQSNHLNSAAESQRDSAISPTTTKIDAPLHRTVSFVPDERRLSNVSSQIESLKKSNKSNKIFNKLQFWKKNKLEDEQDKENDMILYPGSGEKTDIDIETGDEGLELDVKPSPERLNHIQNQNISDKNVNGPKIMVEEPLLEPKSENSFVGNALTISNSLESPRTPPSAEGRGFARTRPSSMISQFSQLSRLSQMSTMLSESELDILDETDTLDDDYEEDEAYESSLNISQVDGRSSASSRAPMKKRPSYRRTLSSDLSIQTGSNSGPVNVKKKLSISKLHSNSSGESGQDELKKMNDENNPLGAADEKNRFRLLSNDTNTNSANFTNGNNNATLPFQRSPSPPVSFKFNHKALVKEQKSGKKIVSPTFFQGKSNTLPKSYQDTKQVNDWINNSQKNGGGVSAYSNKAMFSSVINEEEEGEEL